ncbi:hypothetical protein N0O92_08530 [Alkalihalobacillus sp. MEB130]|uniref:hypothetical protein n=1 Tax=Alkalihalobacillus sp. MEB130 TaxID=2976704 RepID=UPI0028DF239E|nr:hypothetical protein [Alkalihalobacillus sp. MEB130]
MYMEEVENSQESKEESNQTGKDTMHTNIAIPVRAQSVLPTRGYLVQQLRIKD